jgi:DNA-binding MarR family transcriptional regulator
LARDHLSALGSLALSARMKRVSDMMVREAHVLYRELELGIEPNWYLVFLLLDEHKKLSVTEIATALGWSHPSVVSLVGAMQDAGFVAAEEDATDRRRTLLKLSARGRAQLKTARPVWDASRRAIEALMAESGVDWMRGLDALEAALRERGYRQRTLDAMAVAAPPARRTR